MAIVSLRKIHFVITAHITEIYGPVQALRNYLGKGKYSFRYITHPLRKCLITDSLIEDFDKGILVRQKAIKRTKRRLISFIGDLLLNVFLALRYRRGEKILFIGIDNISTLSGIVLKRIGVVHKIIYYVIDYTPRRFKNRVLNRVYHCLDRFCLRHSDYIWNISYRMAELREGQGVKKDRNMVVPVGVEFSSVKRFSSSNINRHRLVFVSYLSKDKGCQLAIEAMVDIVKHRNDVALEIIGTGPYENQLKQLVIRNKLEKNVKFIGYLKQDFLVDNLSRGGIAMASYLDDPDSITNYADPTKVKEYLACGLPVIITKIPWIAKEIERLQMGIAIEYNKEQLVAAALKILENDDFYDKCRKNALAYAFKLDWIKIYDHAFKKISLKSNEKQITRSRK